MAIVYNTSIVRDSLRFIFDYANIKSYPGSGTAVTNLSGGNNGALFGNTVYNSANRYMSFDGTQGTYMRENTGGLGDHGTGSFTYQFLINPKSSTSVDDASYARVFEHSGYPNTWNILQIVHNSGNRYFNYGGRTLSAESFNVNSVTGIALNQWYFLTCSIDRTNNKCRLYVNETLYESNATLTGSIGNSSVLLFPSSYAEMAADYSIILCYNKALTASEVSRNFNALRGRCGI